MDEGGSPRVGGRSEEEGSGEGWKERGNRKLEERRIQAALGKVRG